MSETTDLVERYVAVWNEPDPKVRANAVRDLWVEDGAQILQPPEDMRTAARALGFPATTLRVRGHDDLEFRVGRAHDEFVAPGEYRFRARDLGTRIDDVVKFAWEMVRTDNGDVAATGLDVFVLAGDGRIVTDYQFVD